MQYWLIKSEPQAYSIDDLAAARGKRDHWDGIRNYQARNFMRDGMQVGDRVFFYHSSCPQPGVAGIAEVVRAAYPDHTAHDARSRYYDPQSTPGNPRWFMVDVKLIRKFKHLVSLEALRANPELSGMRLLARGNRLSVMPVAAHEWQIINRMAGAS